MSLKRGSKGEEVKALQRALVAAGFTLDIDGDFGKKTEDAVKGFQRQNGLAADGIAGPKTLKALEAAGGTVITFTPEETDAPPVVKDKVKEYVELLARQHDTLLEKSQDALANFETTMVFASTSEANPDLLGSMLSKVFDFAVDKMLDTLEESNPVTAIALGVAKTAFQAATEELERAGKAAASHAIGDWIKDQRGAIDRLRGKFDRDAVQSEMELGYLESSDQQAFFAGLADGIAKLRAGVLPPVEELERQLYEQWINANFRAIGDDTPGCIQVKVEADDGFDIKSCTVETPSGDKVADALNRVFTKLPGPLRPRDLRVRKRGCFYVENLVPGGHSWSCGWLDQDNQPIHSPVLPEASKVFGQPQWQFVDKFFTE